MSIYRLKYQAPLELLDASSTRFQTTTEGFRVTTRTWRHGLYAIFAYSIVIKNKKQKAKTQATQSSQRERERKKEKKQTRLATVDVDAAHHTEKSCFELVLSGSPRAHLRTRRRKDSWRSHGPRRRKVTQRYVSQDYHQTCRNSGSLSNN